MFLSTIPGSHQIGSCPLDAPQSWFAYSLRSISSPGEALGCRLRRILSSRQQYDGRWASPKSPLGYSNPKKTRVAPEFFFGPGTTDGAFAQPKLVGLQGSWYDDPAKFGSSHKSAIRRRLFDHSSLVFAKIPLFSPTSIDSLFKAPAVPCR